MENRFCAGISGSDNRASEECSQEIPHTGPEPAVAWRTISLPDVFSANCGIYCDPTPELLTQTISELSVSFNKHESPNRTGDNPMLTGSSQIFCIATVFYCLAVTANNRV